MNPSFGIPDQPFDLGKLVKQPKIIEGFRSISFTVYVPSNERDNVLYLISQSFPIDVYNMMNEQSKQELQDRIFTHLSNELILNYNKYKIKFS